MPAPRKRGGAAVAAEPDTLEDLVTPLEQLPQLFGASQHSVASHRKNINTLHALFLRCAQVTTLSSNGKNIKLSGERMFGEAFRNAVVYPLSVKKGVEQADRVIKFVGGFVAFAVEHGELQSLIELQATR
jgi:condensin complex subunit 3